MNLKIIFLCFCVLAFGCSDTKVGETITEPPVDSLLDFSKLSPDCFVNEASNPIIISGDFKTTLNYTLTHWNDPHVIKVGSEYWMYASTDNNFNHDIKIFRLISTDGINWSLNPTTPILEKSAGMFDLRSVETPAVLFFAGQYHLFWTGYTDEQDVGTFKIGHAVSNDGISFVKDAAPIVEPTDPTGQPNLDFNQFLVGEPAPVVYNNKIYLYFTAIGANSQVNTTLQVIGLTTSTDGLNWTTPISALKPDQSLYPRTAPDYYIGYSTPNAIVMNNQIHLYFDVAVVDSAGGSYTQDRLHHAYSVDGINTWIHDTLEIFQRGDFTWTATEIRSPHILLDGATLKLWYAGHAVLTLGIGLATCEL